MSTDLKLMLLVFLPMLGGMCIVGCIAGYIWWKCKKRQRIKARLATLPPEPGKPPKPALFLSQIPDPTQSKLNPIDEVVFSPLNEEELQEMARNTITERQEQQGGAAGREQGPCRVCHNNQISASCVPCGHRFVCATCSEFVSKGDPCVVCHGPIEGFNKDPASEFN